MKEIKKLRLIIVAFALLLGFSQCRKPVFPDYGGESQRQTITFTTGDDGSKGDLFQEESSGSDYKKLKYKWKSGDVVYVYASETGSFDSDGVYCGVLDLDKGSIDQTLGFFKGEIEMPSGMVKNTSKLRFYHIGNGVDFNSTAHTASVSFETQNGEITGSNSVSSKVVGLTKDVIYNGGRTYSGDDCKLKVQFAVVKVNLESFGSDPVAVNTVVNTGVNVNEHGVISYTTGSSMWLTNKTGDYYVVFVPDAVTPVSKEEKVYSFENATKIARIKMNVNSGGFYTLNGEGGAVTLNAEPKVQGVLSGKFSVSGTKQVQFSQGNLQWSANGGGSSPTTHAVATGGTEAGTWRFAEHQYDYIGSSNSSVSASYSGWIDLFGWGTSGYNGKNPYMTSVTYSDYGDGVNDITGTNYDWGVYNAISNGGNSVSAGWRTMTFNEWEHLFKNRNDAGSKWGFGLVNGILGLIFLPDEWTLPTGLTFASGHTKNTYNTNQWDEMEKAGAVFVPSAGVRIGTAVSNVQKVGFIYSSTHCDATDARQFRLEFGDITDLSQCRRHCGLSVRLVRDVVSNGIGSADPFSSGNW